MFHYHYQHELSQQVNFVATVPLDLFVSLTLFLQLQTLSNQMQWVRPRSLFEFPKITKTKNADVSGVLTSVGAEPVV